MKVAFPLAEAYCREFQHLVGTFLESKDATVIEAVIITPYDQQNKDRFFLLYHLFDADAQMALKHEYRGSIYDVMIVARTVNGEMRYESLGEWLDNDDNKKLHITALEQKEHSTSSIA